MEEADTISLFEQPRHPYTQHLIRSLPKIDDRAERVSIRGRPPALDKPPSGCRFHPRCPYAMEICKAEVPALESVGPNHRVACFLLSEKSVAIQTDRAGIQASSDQPTTTAQRGAVGP
jgi:peptide/nickel transport system ATP-binding protein